MKSEPKKETAVIGFDTNRNTDTCESTCLAAGTPQSMPIVPIKEEEEDRMDIKSSLLHQTPTINSEKVVEVKVEQIDLKSPLGDALSLVDSSNSADSHTGLSQDTFCKLCKKSFATRLETLKHLALFHQIKIAWSKSEPYNMLPDVNDPRFYCNSCEKKYGYRTTYHFHLRSFHKMETQKKRILYPNMKPDVNDRNFYCCACEMTSKSKSNYRSHLTEVHGMTLHRVQKKSRLNTKHDIQPDINDPNFYCKSCDKKYSNSSGYRRHLKRIHSKLLPKAGLHHPNVKPDINNPDNYCAACEKTFSRRVGYRRHLENVHKMILPPNPAKWVIVNPELTPDINDANNYCKACEHTFSSRNYYRIHLETMHEVVFPPSPPYTFIIVNTDITPDRDDPNFRL